MKLEGWNMIKEAGLHDQGELKARFRARKKLLELNRMEELSWRQKSRVLWVEEGDKNAKNFHRMASARRKVSFIG